MYQFPPVITFILPLSPVQKSYCPLAVIAGFQHSETPDCSTSFSSLGMNIYFVDVDERKEIKRRTRRHSDQACSDRRRQSESERGSSMKIDRKSNWSIYFDIEVRIKDRSSNQDWASVELQGIKAVWVGYMISICFMIHILLFCNKIGTRRHSLDRSFVASSSRSSVVIRPRLSWQVRSSISVFQGNLPNERELYSHQPMPLYGPSRGGCALRKIL